MLQVPAPDPNRYDDHIELLAQVPELQVLNDAEQKMVIHYAFSGNKAEAARAAGFGKNRVWSAAQQGWHVFSRPKVIAALRALNTYLAQGIQEEITGLIRQIMLDANYDNSEAYDADGNLKNIHDIPPELRSRLLNYKQGRYGPEATWIDKSRAREFLLNLFMTNQSASAGMTVTINMGPEAPAPEALPSRVHAGQFVLDMADKVDAQTLQPPIGKADATPRQPPTNGKADGS